MEGWVDLSTTNVMQCEVSYNSEQCTLHTCTKVDIHLRPSASLSCWYNAVRVSSPRWPLQTTEQPGLSLVQVVGILTVWNNVVSSIARYCWAWYPHDTHGMPYVNSLFLAGLATLVERREKLSRKFFDSVEEPRSCLHHLLPPPRDPALLLRSRAPSKFPRIANRTKKYQSFISHALSKYQTSYFSSLYTFIINFYCFFYTIIQYW